MDNRNLTFKWFLLVLELIDRISKTDNVITSLSCQRRPDITVPVYVFGLQHNALILHCTSDILPSRHYRSLEETSTYDIAFRNALKSYMNYIITKRENSNVVTTTRLLSLRKRFLHGSSLQRLVRGI